MIFRTDTTSSVPIYSQIVTQVKHAIAAGSLRPGDTLPSQRETAARLRVNPLTVAKAYRELHVLGIVVTEHGRGTFISEQTGQLGDEYRAEVLRLAVGRMLREAGQIDASPDEIRAAVEDGMLESRAAEGGEP